MTDEEQGASEAPTERAEERMREDREAVRVIVERSDEARRHPDDVLELAIEGGLDQLGRATLSLILSALAAGGIVGFSALAVGVVASLGPELPMPARIAQALVYPFGFVVCIMSGAELFTEHTATAVYPVLDRRSTVRSLLRLWVLVCIGNLIGAVGVAFILDHADGVIHAAEGYREVALGMVQHDAEGILFSAILAGWLMALGAWLVHATPPSVSQIVSIYLVTFLVGIGELHHSIMGTVEVSLGVFGGSVAAVDAARTIAIAIVGNLIGGSVFVALLNYGHIRRSREDPGQSRA
jgi:formate/nitrite transporter FocA (FNT family)